MQFDEQHRKQPQTPVRRRLKEARHTLHVLYFDFSVRRLSFLLFKSSLLFLNNVENGLHNSVLRRA